MATRAVQAEARRVRSCMEGIARARQSSKFCHCVNFLCGSRRGSKVIEPDSLEDLRLLPPLTVEHHEHSHISGSYSAPATGLQGLSGRESLQAMM